MENDLTSFWLRKTKKSVLAALLVQKPDSTHEVMALLLLLLLNTCLFKYIMSRNAVRNFSCNRNFLEISLLRYSVEQM